MPWLDVLLPRRCPACSDISGWPGPWCAMCAPAARRLLLPTGDVANLAPNVAAVGVFAYAGVVRDAVHGMKLRGRHWAADPLGEAVLAHPRVDAAWPVTWVPSTPARRRRRGLDLARNLAGPGALRLLHRAVERPDQTSLDAAARRRSPAGAFRPVGEVAPRVVLVDDVRTTGATAAAAAAALLAGGAREVLVATLAVGGDQARSVAAV